MKTMITVFCLGLLSSAHIHTMIPSENITGNVGQPNEGSIAQLELDVWQCISLLHPISRI